jgi:hypothetical protein
VDDRSKIIHILPCRDSKRQNVQCLRAESLPLALIKLGGAKISKVSGSAKDTLLNTTIYKLVFIEREGWAFVGMEVKQLYAPKYMGFRKHITCS